MTRPKGAFRAGGHVESMKAAVTNDNGTVPSEAPAPPHDGTSHNEASVEQPAQTQPADTSADAEWQLADEVADAFLVGYGGLTADSYGYDLKAFFAFARDKGIPPLRFTRAGLEQYAKRLGADRAAATVARHLAALSGFYKWAEDEDLIVKNPMARVRRPKVPQDSQDLGLSRDEMLALLEAAQGHSPRAHAMVALLVGNGLRIAEVLGAQATDLAEQRGIVTLRVRRKGGRLVVVPLAPETAQAVRGYLNGRPSGPLILSRTGRELDRGSAGVLLRAVASTVMDPARVAALHPHSCRHGWVAASLDAGIGVPDVMAAAGHRSPQVTLRYDRTRNEISADHPAFKLAAWLNQEDLAPDDDGPHDDRAS
jgi:integrase